MTDTPDPPPLPRRARALLWLLVRTVRTRPDTPANRERCERSRFVWGIPPGRKRLHLRVLGLVNGLLRDDELLTLFYDEDGRPVGADFGEYTPGWGEQMKRRPR